MRWLLAHPEQGRETGKRGHAVALEHFHYQSHSAPLLEFISRRLTATA